MLPSFSAAERRQWVRLVRMSFGRLMDAALASREIAAEYFVVWSAALLLTPPLFYTVQRTSAYPWIRQRSLEALQQVALTDRLFFVVWSMLAAMLIASVLWDALFPDRTDQQILGVLPVRSRTVAAARLAASMAVGLAFTVAIALPTAVLYSVSGTVHPSIGPIPAVFAGHLIATVLAGLFVFSAMLLLRGLLVVTFGSAMARKAAVLMQLVTVLLLVESFMFLPGIVPGLVRELLQGRTDLSVWPPVWFIAAYTRVAGPDIGAMDKTAGWAYVSAIGTATMAAATYLLPARVNARRALESRDGDRAGRVLPTLVRWTARVTLRSPASRALLRFTLVSLLRNRQPLLVVATYVGLGMAVAGIRLTSAAVRGHPLPLDAPYDYLVALPLVMSFALVWGVRSAFAAPAELPANWTFRVMASTASGPCANATRAALMVLGVVPVSVVTFVASALLWDARAAASVSAMHAASGLVLCEALTLGCRAVPFARARGVDPTSLRVGAPLALLGLHLFAFRLDDLQRVALGARAGVGTYVALALVAVICLRIYDGVRARPRDLTFESEEEPAVRQLGLAGIGR